MTSKQIKKSVYSKSKSSNKTVTIIVLIILLIGTYSFFNIRSYEQPSAHNQTLVEVIPVTMQPLSDQVEALGSSYANESVDITANVTETISAIHFDDGQHVQKGDVIAVLEQAEEQAQLLAAQLQLQEHDRELKRLAQLIEKKAASLREFDERRTRHDITLQGIEEIKARIADRTLVAPFDGVLSIRNISAGALVRPGDVITTIEDINRIKLDFSVPSRYLAQLQPSIAIEAETEAFPDSKFVGQIETINNKVDPVTRSVMVRAIIDNPSQMMRSGMLMKVTLLKNQRQGLVAPEEAIIQKGGEHFVLVVNDGTVEQRRIGIGVYHDGMVEVVDGLSEGERVIVRGVHKVRPNSTVKVTKVWEGYRAPQPGDLGEN